MKNNFQSNLLGQIFKLANNHFCYPSKPSNYKTEANSSGETDLQRKIILCKESIISNQIVKWLDIELPVILNENPRRPSIDLVGKSDETYFICELKFGEKSNNPYEALSQLLSYYLCILFNSSELEKSKIHHSNALYTWNWEEIKLENTELIVAADSSYWENIKDSIDIDLIENIKKTTKVKSISFYEVDAEKNIWLKKQ